MTTIRLTQDQIDLILLENCDTAPPIDPEPPIDPPPIEPPIDPIDPPDPTMQNNSFSGVFGTAIRFPSTPGDWDSGWRRRDILIHKSAGMSMAIKLPGIPGPVQIVIVNSGSPYGPNSIRHAQFSWHRDFEHPLVSKNLGLNTIVIDLDQDSSGRTLFFNVKLLNDLTVPWGLQIQPMTTLL